MASEEEEEVRSLLTRHRTRIINDLSETDLIKVLVKNSVLNISQENIFNGNNCNEIDVNNCEKTNNVVVQNNDLLNGEEKCTKLIDFIAKNGFEKFKQFCYAIENECPQLIEDLINDRLQQSKSNIGTKLSEADKEKKENDQVKSKEPDVEPPIDYDEDSNNSSSRSRRAASYGGTVSPVPVAAPRRASVRSLSPNPPTQPQSNQEVATLPTPAHRSNANFKLSQEDSLNFHPPPPPSISSNYSSLLCHASSAASPKTERKREKILHRFSDAATLGRRLKKKKNTNRTCHSMTEAIELLADPVVEDDVCGERTSWEYHTVSVTRVPGYGFGIAVSGGRDNPHFANGDPSIAVSDVLKGGPAEERLQVNDRIVSVNGVSLENVEYATAVQVLRDSGNTVTLVVKRRVPNMHMSSSHQHSLSLNSAIIPGGGVIPVAGSGIGMSVGGGVLNSQLPPNNPAQPLKAVLTKASKKEDFGIVLGCRLFIKEISSKAREQLSANGYSLQEGDVLTRIHNTNCSDTMSLKEAKKIMDGCKERLNLTVVRDISNQTIAGTANTLNNSTPANPPYSHMAQISSCSNNLDEAYLGGASYSTQNLYVQPPTRGSSGIIGDEKSNLTPRGRSRGPLMDVSLSQLDRPSTPPGGVSTRRSLNPDEPPRPPPPRTEEFYSSRRQLYEEDPLQRSRQSAEPRFISFQKEGSVGIRLTGGNEAGIFVTAVQPGSPASLQGLTPGDKILKVNDMDMHGITREEAVLFLLSLQDRIDLIVQHCKEEYDEAVANQRGDSFHIKTHFHCENPSKGEMSFKAGDVFRVTDTLHNGVVGSWQVLKIGRSHQEMQRGVIPNKSRAEELATAQFNANKKEMNASESRGNFFRRKRSTHRRSKSLSRENWDDVVFSDSISKFPAYERVVLRHPGFVRPVVLFGPVADVAREKLIKDFPDKFTAPLQDDDKSNSKCRIVRLSNIRDIMDRGKHALLDITPNAVDRLNYAQFYPIVIFLKTDTKHIIKQLRQGIPKSAHKSSKKLLEQCQKLDRIWSHIFSTVIVLNDVDAWYRKLREAIDLQQSGAVWMSESKPVESLSDDFLFPMTTSRLSYASSPESDLELSPGPSASLSLGSLPQLVKSSSDPSIATNQDNLDGDRDIGEGLPPPYTHPYDITNGNHNRRPTMDNKYSFATNGLNAVQGGVGGGSANIISQPIYGMTVPELPPRIDRASKPPGGGPSPTKQPHQQPPSQGSAPNTIGRSAQERLFGKQPSDESQDDYVTRNSSDSIDRVQNSLDRQRINNLANTNNIGGKAAPPPTQNGSYDSVSSYDSYNATQLSGQSIKLGPNAPDDLKSVPNANARPTLPVVAGEYRANSNDSSLPNRSSLHEQTRSLHDHQSRSFVGANDLNRQNSPGRPPYHDINPTRNIESRNPPNPHDIRSMQPGLNITQRPTNLGLESSPRKQMVETKTDYGKYSRNNSTSQADYNKSPKSAHIISSSSVSGGNNGGGMAFKPVPPPKPKNYRPPIQGQMNPSAHWDNGNGMEQNSPRSPNGFFYPPTPSHYHHSQTSGSPHNANSNNGNVQPIQAYGHYTPGQQQAPYPPSNGYNNGGNNPYAGQYMHRGHPSMGNYPHHTPERPTLDLTGTREQRGSAFELYRKPQVGSTGHHHNMSEMRPYQRYYDSPNRNGYQRQQMCSPDPRQQQSQQRYQHQQQQYYQNYYANEIPPPLPPQPPPLLPPKTKKKSVFKSPLAALKNAFMKSTKPLRRMNSMVEPERKLKPCLRRQHSMMERGYVREHYYPPEEFVSHRMVQQQYVARHEPFHPRDLNSTYQNLENEDIYGIRDERDYNQDNCDDLYANRALIDLERRQAELKSGNRRIVRRHSMADRTNSQRNPFLVSQNYEAENSIRNQKEVSNGQNPRAPSSAVMMRRRFYSDRHEDPIYQSRREMHRNHLYQSRKEMQERIAQGKREIEREFSPQTSSQSAEEPDEKSDRESIYQSRKEVRDNGYKTRAQLREQIYQTRREAMESMAEPIYVSKREVMKHEPIYESREECVTASKENVSEENVQNTEKDEIDRSSDTLNTDNNLTNTRSDETSSENTVIAARPSTATDLSEYDVPRSQRVPYHISNIIKRTAPPPVPSTSMNTSRTSMETHYTSQASLPVGPPNASSTPYTSDISLPVQDRMDHTKPVTAINPREPSTTRGVFDETGGTLSDSVWNVSLHIPPGAIPPGVRQEIYFTVTDPRMSESVGGPPLDMENGETMLSPLVMCGPQGLEFLVPVTLNIPHCAGRTASLGLSLKATDSEHNLQTNWDNIDLPSNTAAHTVSVKVDHF